MAATNCLPDEPQSQEAERSRDYILASILDNPHLPTPPALALRIVENASKADCQPKDITQLLCQDPGLCGKVLKTVNSSMFGLSKAVTTLERAIMVLGLKPLRSLVLGLSLPAIQTRNVDSPILKYWQESVTGAVIARELAVRLDLPEPEDCLTAGLLRDLGIVVLAQVFPDEYRTLDTADRQRFEMTPTDVEEEIFGVQHAEIAAVVLDSWRLPPEIVQPVRFHHHPEALQGVPAAVKERAWLLFLAAQLARVEILVDHPKAMQRLFDVAQSHFGLTAKALGEVLEELTPRIAEFASVLQVDIGPCANLGATLAAASDALVKLSLEGSQVTAAPPTKHPASAGKHSHSTSVRGKASPSAFRLSKETVPGNEALTEFDLDYFGQLLQDGCLGGYELRELIGRGGMGVVFKGYDPGLARWVAIKMLLPQLVVSADARKRFEREARSIAAIQHENVVAIYAVSDYNGLPYLVMEYVEGASIETRLAKQGPLPIADVVRFGRHIAGGLAAAHSRRVIHRDVKPANILIEERTRSVKLTDFGLARAMDEVSQTQQGLIAGTPLFMAPEQFAGSKIDERADLFSLGTVLYTMVSGKPPFQGDSFMALMKQVCEVRLPPLRNTVRNFPSWLDLLIARLHAKQPGARYQSATEVIREFDKNASA